jgi:hypothetical protein
VDVVPSTNQGRVEMKTLVIFQDPMGVIEKRSLFPDDLLEELPITLDDTLKFPAPDSGGTLCYEILRIQRGVVCPEFGEVSVNELVVRRATLN